MYQKNYSNIAPFKPFPNLCIDKKPFCLNDSKKKFLKIGYGPPVRLMMELLLALLLLLMFLFCCCCICRPTKWKFSTENDFGCCSGRLTSERRQRKHHLADYVTSKNYYGVIRAKATKSNLNLNLRILSKDKVIS